MHVLFYICFIFVLYLLINTTMLGCSLFFARARLFIPVVAVFMFLFVFFYHHSRRFLRYYFYINHHHPRSFYSYINSIFFFHMNYFLVSLIFSLNIDVMFVFIHSIFIKLTVFGDCIRLLKTQWKWTIAEHYRYFLSYSTPPLLLSKEGPYLTQMFMCQAVLAQWLW